MNIQLTPVEFNGDTIFAVEQPDGIYIVAKPIAERFGLAWQRQLERLKSDPVLSEGVTTAVIPSPGGAQETTCLRLDLLNGWLFKIDSRRVKPEAREALIAYQRECYAVLFRHFQPTAAEMAPAPDEGIVTIAIPSEMAPDTLGEISSFVGEVRRTFNKAEAARVYNLLVPPALRAGRQQVIGGVTVGEGRACLEYLLGLDAGGRAVSDWLAEGQDSIPLNRVGLRVRDDGLFVANQTPVFAASRWSGGRHRAALSMLPGVHALTNPLMLMRRRDRGLLLTLGTIAEISHATI